MNAPTSQKSKSNTNAKSQPQAILMAAGKGTRMGGDLPKVLYPVANQPMLHWVLKACHQAGVSRCVVVVGYQGDRVRCAVESFLAEGQTPGMDVVFVEQTEQLGTGHAVMVTRPVFKDAGNDCDVCDCDVFVLAGDGPLIRDQTLTRVLEVHRDNQAVATLATSVIEDPSGYGRVLRDENGGFDQIVEQKDATPEQLAVQEVNPSYYCFNAAQMFDALDRVTNQNASGEYYITDVPGLLKQDGKTVTVVDAVPAEDVLSINNPTQLAEVDAIFRKRLQEA